MTPSPPVVLEVFGEGKTDLGEVGSTPRNPDTGVLPILISRLCGRPTNMLVRCKPLQFLQGKKTPQKVRFAKRQAVYNRSAGAVFVLDTEGQHPRVLQELTTGRNSGFASFPMAVGVAHACIEAWLLCDAVAIAQVLSLAGPPTLPSSPENLPAPSNNRSNNPKVVLGNTAVPPRADLSADEKWQIAEQMDLASVRSICLCFEAFALEVETRILPLFQPPPSP